MNLKIVIGYFLLLVSIKGIAQYPNDLHNSDLRVWLKSNLYNSQFDDLGYNNAREQMYSYTDESSNSIYCIYTDFEMDSEFTTYPNPINAEHIVPQSFYGGVSPMRSDIHNIRPSHQSANSARSNYGFGEVVDNQANWYGINSNGGYVSSNSEPAISQDYSEGVNGQWEPQEDRKGDIARHIFYFYTMYPTQAGALTELVDLSLAYQWHLDDPADNLEIQRNNRIEQVQGNRNPYIDYPELVYEAWLLVPNSGCADPDYLEFNPEATSDDGSCITEVVLGCRYEHAINFNPLANRDDNGSCIFEDYCPADFNDDLIISAFDLSMFLGIFGTNCD